MNIVEFRGVDNLVAAEVTNDDNELEGGYTAGDVFPVAGVAALACRAVSSRFVPVRRIAFPAQGKRLSSSGS